MSDETDLVEQLVTAAAGARLVSETEDLVAPVTEAANRCAQCGGPLPIPLDRLAVVHGRDGELMTTCSTACLAALVVALAGRTGEPAAGRTN